MNAVHIHTHTVHTHSLLIHTQYTYTHTLDLFKSEIGDHE